MARLTVKGQIGRNGYRWLRTVNDPLQKIWRAFSKAVAPLW
jgi:hypothetical protein